MVPMFKHRQWLCAFIGLFVSLGTARADWPEKQITMVACFAAGGGTDIAARIINTQLGEALGKPVVVENRGGAGGNIAIESVAKSAPDGYTIVMAELAALQEPDLDRADALDPGTRARMDQGRHFAATDYLRALRRRPLVLAQVLGALDQVDVLVTPGLGGEAADFTGDVGPVTSERGVEFEAPTHEFADIAPLGVADDESPAAAGVLAIE